MSFRWAHVTRAVFSPPEFLDEGGLPLRDDDDSRTDRGTGCPRRQLPPSPPRDRSWSPRPPPPPPPPPPQSWGRTSRLCVSHPTDPFFHTLVPPGAGSRVGSWVEWMELSEPMESHLPPVKTLPRSPSPPLRPRVQPLHVLQQPLRPVQSVHPTL